MIRKIAVEHLPVARSLHRAVFHTVLDRGGRDAVMRNYSQILEMISKRPQCSRDMVSEERIAAARGLLEESPEVPRGKRKRRQSSLKRASNLQETGKESFQRQLKVRMRPKEVPASSPDEKDRECAVCLDELSLILRVFFEHAVIVSVKKLSHGRIKTAPRSTGPIFCRSEVFQQRYHFSK